MSEKETNSTGTTQISFRLPATLREFYASRATQERRKLSDMLRIALEDHTKTILEAEARKKRRLKLVPTPASETVEAS